MDNLRKNAAKVALSLAHKEREHAAVLHKAHSAASLAHATHSARVITVTERARLQVRRMWISSGGQPCAACL